MNRRFKLYVLYVHFGSAYDWPLRIAASSNGYGESLIPSSRIGEQKGFYPRIEFDHLIKTNAHQTWSSLSGGRASLVFFELEGKVPKAFINIFQNETNANGGGYYGDGNNKKEIPEIDGLNLNLSVFGRMATESDRPCWRNCGTSLFTFNEIFTTSKLGAVIRTHLVYNTGGGVKKADVVSGCIAVSAANDLKAALMTVGTKMAAIATAPLGLIGGLNSATFREAQSALSLVEYLDRDWKMYAEGVDKKLYGQLIRPDHQLQSRIRCTWSFTDLNLVKKRLSGRSVYEPDGRMSVRMADKLLRDLMVNAKEVGAAIPLVDFCRANKEEIRHVVDSCKSVASIARPIRRDYPFRSSPWRYKGRLTSILSIGRGVDHRDRPKL